MYLILGAAVAATVLGIIPGSISVVVTAIQALHLSNYYSIVKGWDGLAPGTGIYWSLAVEEHFYLLFPLSYIALRRFMPVARWQAFFLLGLCAAVLAWRLTLVFALGATIDRTYVATDTRIDSILFGCVLAIFGNPALGGTAIAERWWKWILFPLAVVGLLASFLVRDPRFQETIRYSLQGLCLYPLFVVAVRYPEWGPFRFLSVPAVRFIGVLSYSFYLVHQTVLFAVQAHVPLHPFLQGAVALGLSLTVAFGVHLLVERPCARLRRRLARIHRAQPADGSLAPQAGSAVARGVA